MTLFASQNKHGAAKHTQSLRPRPYVSVRWLRLRKLALERAGYRCEECHRPGRLEVHHKHPIRDGGEPFPEVSGLLTLCRACHIRAHKPKESAGVQEWREFAAELRYPSSLRV